MLNQENKKDENLEKQIEEKVKKFIPKYLANQAFSDRKITDTPTDALQVVPRKYVNLSGSVAGRPSSVVATIGQKFFASDTKIPMVFDGTNWYNGVGSVVAQG